jgi:hypothetical protein
MIKMPSLLALRSLWALYDNCQWKNVAEWWKKHLQGRRCGSSNHFPPMNYEPNFMGV